MNNDAKLIYEAYTKNLDEGIVGRTAARLGGLGASLTQPIKNIGAGIKSVGQLATGNVAGAQQTMAGVRTSDQAKFDAKVKSITGQYVKKITDDLVKLGLVGADKAGEISNAVNNAISVLVKPATQPVAGTVTTPTPAQPAPAPAAPVAPAPTKLVSKQPAAAKGAGGISKNELNKILGGGVVKKNSTTKKTYK
jgi:hypothetical protein